MTGNQQSRIGNVRTWEIPYYSLNQTASEGTWSEPTHYFEAGYDIGYKR